MKTATINAKKVTPVERRDLSHLERDIEDYLLPGTRRRRESPTAYRMKLPGEAAAFRRTGEGPAAPARRRRRPGSPGGGSAGPGRAPRRRGRPTSHPGRRGTGTAARITLITSNRPGLDGAGLDQRDEGDRQRDHEGQQRAGPDLARGRRRSPHRMPRRPAPPATIASCDQAGKRPQSMWTNSDRPASISRVTTIDRTTPSADLLAEQSRSPDQSPSQAREGVLLPLQRQRAGDQEHRHEHQGHRRGDRDRERVEARRRARDDLLLDLDRVRDRGEQRRCEVEVLAGQAREPDHLVAGRRRTGCWPAAPAAPPRGSAAVFFRPRMLRVWPSRLKLPPLSRRVEVGGRRCA